MFSLFSKQPHAAPLLTDVHSHLLPGVDDGAKTIEESFAIIDQMIDMGYTKIITTPHIMSGYYNNTIESLTKSYEQFLPVLRKKGYTIPFECAAEYYLDEQVHARVVNKETFLTFGQRCLLFETNFISEPYQLKEFIFQLTLQGYRPVLAHPERYQYMSLEKAEDLRNRGVLLQVNMLSLIGAYGPPIQKLAEKLISKRWVDMLGSDCHNLDHVHALGKVLRSSYYRKALDLPLLNNSL